MGGAAGEREMPVDQLVLVDPGALAELPGQFGSPGNALAFVADVRAMWPVRLGRLEESIAAGDSAAAAEAATSIKVASHMSGAVMLAALAASLEAHLALLVRHTAGNGDPDSPAHAGVLEASEGLRELVDAVRECGGATVEELGRYL